MTRNEFILQIKDEIRGSCALPYSVPDKEINRIIDQAKKWFYLNYIEAVETKYYVIPQKEFEKPEFKNTRTILMPKCVVTVYNVKEITGGGRLFGSDPDFSSDRIIASEILLSPDMADSLVMRTVQYSFWDLTKAFFLETIAYDFNINTKKIKIKGRTPRRDVFIEAYVEIPEEDLFEDYLFLRFCTASTKVALGRILGFFEYQLPGGITVNAGDLKAEGQEEIEKIKEEIDAQQPPDYFMVFH